MIPLVLSGGNGTRLWPLSRKQFPKQFHALTGDLTLFQQTLKRLEGCVDEAPMVVCNHQHRFVVNEQLRALGMDATASCLSHLAAILRQRWRWPPCSCWPTGVTN